MNKENNIENEASAIKRSSIYKAFPSNLLIPGAETIQVPTGPFRLKIVRIVREIIKFYYITPKHILVQLI